MRATGFAAAILVGLLVVPAGPLAAQVVRESGVETVAGVLDDGETYDELSFSSSGGEILFASVDSQIYLTGSQDHHEEPAPSAAAEEPGGGCGEDEGGPGRLCLQVVDSRLEVICWGTRPRMPGWQRDPRLVCVLPETDRPETYLLRVTWEDETCDDLAYPQPQAGLMVPYLLNVSLRRIAPEGALAPAIALSRNRL